MNICECNNNKITTFYGKYKLMTHNQSQKVKEFYYKHLYFWKNQRLEIKAVEINLFYSFLMNIGMLTIVILLK